LLPWSIPEANKKIHMKKYLFALAAFSMVAVAANAQSASDSTQNSTYHQHSWNGHQKNSGYAMGGRYHRNMHGYRHDNMMMNVKLTDTQKQQVKALNDDYRKKLIDLEKNDNITLKNYRAEKATLMKERKARYQDILTPEQKSEIAQAKKQRSEKMQMMAQKRMEKMKTTLNLTDDQVAKIQEQQKSSMEKAKEIRENTSLSEEQKREQMMELRKAGHDNMNNILTADQLKKMEEMRNNRMNEMKNRWQKKDS
jgi:Spy/CpxP family protein refolding chaperone